MNRLSFTELLLLLTFVFAGLYTSYVISFDTNRPVYYTNLYWLPFTYSVLSILFYRIYVGINRNLVYLLVVTLYSLRNVFTPLMMYYGEYSGFFTRLTIDNVNKAVALLCFENICVFAYLYERYKKDVLRINTSERHIYRQIKKGDYICGVLLILYLFFCIISYWMIPAIRESYSSIFAADALLDVGVDAPSRGIIRVVFTLFILAFNVVRILIPIAIIYFFRKKMGHSWLGIFIGFFLGLSQFFFVGGETMYVLLVFFLIIGIIYKLFYRCRKKIAILGGIIVLVPFIYLSVLKANAGVGESTDSIFNQLSMFMQAYLPGVCNVAAFFNVNNPNKLSTLFFDFYTMIPFRGTLFGLEGDRLVIVYTKQNNTPFQILPCISQAYHYIGILAPIVPCLLIRFAIYIQAKFRRSVNIWQYTFYLLAMVYVSVSPILYNVTILGVWLFATLLSMFLLIVLTGKSSFFINEIKEK